MCTVQLGRVKRIWYLSPMRVAKVQASLRIRAVSPEPPLLAHTSSVSRGTFRQKAKSRAPLNGWVCAVKIWHDGMLEDTNSLDAVQFKTWSFFYLWLRDSELGHRIYCLHVHEQSNNISAWPIKQLHNWHTFFDIIEKFAIKSVLHWTVSVARTVCMFRY